jgi:pantoate--beta-alanine ligase
MLVREISKVKEIVSEWKKQGLTVGLVPTMGSLHNGHLSLIKTSVEKCDKTVVSVFVNPIQFGPAEDYGKYPRVIEKDMELCDNAGVDIVFSPSPEEMYGTGNILSNNSLTYVTPPFFYVDKLCGKTRVGHFEGVCTVVTKLFNIVQPNFAFFGQKDAQQLIIIKKMVHDLNMPLEIVPCPIVREESGLALSSRNSYFSEEGKKNALALNKVLTNIKKCYKNGITDVKALSETAFEILNENVELEYLEFVDKNNLEDKKVADDDTLVLIAARVKGLLNTPAVKNEPFTPTNSVRLIDNCFIS